MVPAGHVIAAVISACSVIGPLADATTQAPAPLYEGWSGTAGWLPLPAAASGPPTESWRVGLAADAAYTVQSGLVLVAEVSDGGTSLRRIDAATGDDVWRSEVVGTGEAQLAIDAAGSIVVVAADAPDGFLVVTVVGAAKGQVIWEESGFEAMPFVQPFAPLLIVAAAAESVAVNAADGAVAWRIDGQITVYPGSLVLHAESSARSAGSFGVVDPATGQPMWDRERPPGAIATALGDVVMLSHDEDGHDDSLAGFDRTTGEPRWTTAIQLVGNSGAWPLGTDGALYGGNSDPELPGNLVGVDLLSGSSRWARPYHKPGGLAMWRGDGRQVVFSRTSDAAVEVIDVASGDLAMSSTDVPPGWPSFSSGTLYVQDTEGGAVTGIDMASLQPLWSLDLAVGQHVIGAVERGFVSVQDGELSGPVLAGLLG